MNTSSYCYPNRKWNWFERWADRHPIASGYGLCCVTIQLWVWLVVKMLQEAAR